VHFVGYIRVYTVEAAYYNRG